MNRFTVSARRCIHRFTRFMPVSFVPSKFVSMPSVRMSSSMSVLPLSPMICFLTPANIGSFITPLHFSTSSMMRCAWAVLPCAASRSASAIRCCSSFGSCISFAIRVASAS